jgi:hypothetical protein
MEGRNIADFRGENLQKNQYITGFSNEFASALVEPRVLNGEEAGPAA